MRHLVVTFALVFAVCLADAEAQDKIHTLGILSPNAGEVDRVRAFTLPELARLGFTEGANLRVIARVGAGGPDKLDAAARELVAESVDVIVAVSSPATHAARAHTGRIPIVMAPAGDDPVADGLVQSFIRPGGNVTGLVMLGTEGDVKRLEFARQATPEARRIGLLVGPIGPSRLPILADAGARLGVQTVPVSARDASEYASAFAALRVQGAESLVILADPIFYADARDLSALATRNGLPTICQWREMAEAGCLIGFGPSYRRLRARTADYVAQLLRGAPPESLPVEQPAIFEVVVNLKTAQVLGIEIPPAILARADEVIE